MTENIFIPDSRQDKFGFYTVDGLKFYSKFEALQLAGQVNKPIKWNFNDAVYQAQDWSQEPTESLSEIYRQRAQQLRDQYDYLVLWYSGGSDSSNILDSFVNNDIRLDEVASCINYEATGNDTDIVNGEIFHVARPRVQQAQVLQPDLKYTVTDISQLSLDFFNDTKLDWIYHINTRWNPNLGAKFTEKIKLQNPVWADMIAQGKKVGFIWGTNKPLVNQIGNKFYFKFDDTLNISAEAQFQNHDGRFEEFFYWTPDMPKLVIKQAHVVRNHLMAATAKSAGLVNTTVNPDFMAKNRFGTGCSVVVNQQVMHYDNELLNYVIYPGWTGNPYQQKSVSSVFVEKDHWFFNQGDSEESKRIYRMGMEKLWQDIPEEYRKDRTKFTMGWKRSSSTPYLVGN
jgi:hypothetical protein